MSIMNAELYDALVDAGAGEEKARAAAGAIGDVNTLATKADVKAEIADVKTALVEQKADILKWMVGAMIAQAGLVVALILGLLPLLLQ